ncbi:AAA family ATPase [Georgenia yuyongxinii]|uniref:Nuclease SbcCD subunit C n=1 Tax=Georgenia yuyongxinii TaxID=2589797 RepID=A0A552WMP7_9MICO|nr:SMC family ATPase [Georgenia yuyongxinii]TRW44051.1 SMC family ATPase [Georgenia yuyongxinii]
MRVHRLTLRAIGPFPDEHTIDFDTLAAGGLFLLEGPTGSGKSTIIDAVVFALYGTVAGAESSEDRLHSDHADREVEPFVELTFSTAAGIYKVRRTPKYLRPKKRGDGFTRQNPTATLWRLATVDDEHGEPVSAHVQEASSEVRRIVVLDRAQFTQTVVLPQGQFASFLRARPEDRRQVLQDVFGTEIYQQVQDRLAAMAREARRDVDQLATVVGGQAEAFITAAGLPEEGDAAARPGEDAVTDAAAPQARPDDGAPPAVTAQEIREAAAALDEAALADRTDAVCVALGALAAAADDAEKGASAIERAARSHLESQEALDRHLARRAVLLGRQASLAAAEAQVAADAERLGRARRAAVALPSLRAREEAAQAAGRTTARWQQLVAEATSGPHADLLALSSTGTDVDALDAAVDAASAEQGSLTDLVVLEAALERRGEALAATERSISTDREGLEELDELLTARPAARTTLVGRLETARTAAAPLADARTRAHLATTAAEAAAAAAALDGEVRTARAVVEAAGSRAGQALDAEHAVRRRWVEGMAGTLAAGLVGGQPCTVCGSTAHPAPAAPAPDGASGDDVEAARQAREQADKDLVAAVTVHTRLTEQLQARRDAAGGLDVQEATAQKDRADQAVAEAAAGAELASGLEEELGRFDAETAALTAEVNETRGSLAQRQTLAAGVRARLEEDTRRCTQARGTEGSVAARAAVLTARAACGHALRAARQQVLTAERALAEAAGRVADALAEAGFADEAAAMAAALPPAEITRLETVVLEHRTALAQVAEGLAEPAIAALTGTEVADVAGAHAAFAAAHAACTQATRHAERVRAHADHAHRGRERLLTAMAGHAARARAVGPLLRAANLANAQDGTETATTLATYVLLRRFEDVVAAANDRLTTMSDGRYSLERIDEREGGQRSRKAGLGLQVRDHLTEAPRDPHTLSGGETFYVSLCLALGLADVVRAEAGGVELGTLFVDEGFGSLDPGTLDAVMTELGRLREGGRAVGIVSHVAELKDRIAERIEVRRLPSGASTLTVRA